MVKSFPNMWGLPRNSSKEDLPPIRDKPKNFKNPNRMYLPHTGASSHMLGGSSTIWNIMDSIITLIAEAAITRDKMLDESSGHEPGSDAPSEDDTNIVNMVVHSPSFWGEEISIETCDYHHVEGKRFQGVQKYIDSFKANAEADFFKQQKEICDKDN